jgi:hypothetical protein
MARIGNSASAGAAFGTPTREIRGVSSVRRTCDQPGCATVLSRYNRDTSCWLHAQPTFTTRSADRHGA